MCTSPLFEFAHYYVIFFIHYYDIFFTHCYDTFFTHYYDTFFIMQKEHDFQLDSTCPYNLTKWVVRKCDRRIFITIGYKFEI